MTSAQIVGLMTPHSRRPQRWAGAPYVVVGLLAAVLAAFAARSVTLPVNSDLGLVQTLPPAYWVGMVVLNGAFVLALGSGAHHRTSQWAMATLLCALVVTMYGAASFASSTTRGEVAWRHVGIAESLVSSGQVTTQADAYFSWPGFFALIGTFSRASGIQALDLTPWAPVVNGLLWLAALALVVRALTADKRRLWLTLWVFCLGNWIDQDYLSPQAFGFFLYLVVVALLLTALSASAGTPASWRPSALLVWWRARTPAEPDRRLRLGALLLCLLMCLAMVASHQLSPFMLFVAIVALVVLGRSWAPGLPVLLGLMLAIWLAFPASAYLVGHPPLRDTGLEAAASAGVVDRLGGTPGHEQVVHVRILVTAVIWLLAAAGARTLWKRRSLDLRAVALALTPFVLFPAQSYGGEILLRVALFALPFMAYLASEALLGSRRRLRWGRLVAIGVVCSLLAVGSITARFGNARFDMFTPAEIQATQRLYAIVPANAILISGAHPTPWRYRDYLQHRALTVGDLCGPRLSGVECSNAVVGAARRNTQGALVMLSRASKSSLVLQGLMTSQAFDDFEVALARRVGVELVYQNADARIYRIEPSRV
jgi:hypothetical protein